MIPNLSEKRHFIYCLIAVRKRNLTLRKEFLPGSQFLSDFPNLLQALFGQVQELLEFFLRNVGPCIHLWESWGHDLHGSGGGRKRKIGKGRNGLLEVVLQDQLEGVFEPAAWAFFGWRGGEEQGPNADVGEWLGGEPTLQGGEGALEDGELGVEEAAESGGFEGEDEEFLNAGGKLSEILAGEAAGAADLNLGWNYHIAQRHLPFPQLHLHKDCILDRKSVV